MIDSSDIRLEESIANVQMAMEMALTRHSDETSQSIQIMKPDGTTKTLQLKD